MGNNCCSGPGPLLLAGVPHERRRSRVADTPNTCAGNGFSPSCARDVGQAPYRPLPWARYAAALPTVPSARYGVVPYRP
ncbi:hypothetical protein STSP_04760 [Streptomyces jeddahensis]|uniref:Uncharacterized protein n=1 Tax=Streptomyces jeddahensis TaxID=1716141 RepID=A0A177HZP0_9ACTN|nr:hypothetical protein STSP_04760 [Streptomyces jeddahensis]